MIRKIVLFGKLTELEIKRHCNKKRNLKAKLRPNQWGIECGLTQDENSISVN